MPSRDASAASRPHWTGSSPPNEWEQGLDRLMDAARDSRNSDALIGIGLRNLIARADARLAELREAARGE